MELMQHFHQQGASILLVTHDASVATYADKVLLILDGKIKKEDVGESLNLDLKRNVDILQSLKEFKCKKIGFKLEISNENALKSARSMLEKKRLDAVCLNILGEKNGFASEQNEVNFITKDDEILLDLISEYLSENGYDVTTTNNAKDALDLAYERNFDLLILDVKLPQGDGFSLLSSLRELGVTTPSIFTTSLNTIDDLEKGYKSGCDDYLKKPFELAELKFRVAELMRKYYGTDDKNIVKINDEFSFNLNKRVLLKDGKMVDLSAKEVALVECLVSHLNSYVSMEELRDLVWNDKEIEGADIRMHVLKIRNKTNNNFIISKRRIGYKIDAQEL